MDKGQTTKALQRELKGGKLVREEIIELEMKPNKRKPGEPAVEGVSF